MCESPTWTACRSWRLRARTSSKGHRLESMRRWARISFRSLLGGLPMAEGDKAPDSIGLMASIFFMTTCHMFSMVSVLEVASRPHSPSHLPRNSCSCTSMLDATLLLSYHRLHNNKMLIIKWNNCNTFNLKYQLVSLFYYPYIASLAYQCQHIFSGNE